MESDLAIIAGEGGGQFLAVQIHPTYQLLKGDQGCGSGWSDGFFADLTGSGTKIGAIYHAMSAPEEVSGAFHLQGFFEDFGDIASDFDRHAVFVMEVDSDVIAYRYGIGDDFAYGVVGEQYSESCHFDSPLSGSPEPAGAVVGFVAFHDSHYTLLRVTCKCFLRLRPES